MRVRVKVSSRIVMAPSGETDDHVPAARGQRRGKVIEPDFDSAPDISRLRAKQDGGALRSAQWLQSCIFREPYKWRFTVKYVASLTIVVLTLTGCATTPSPTPSASPSSSESPSPSPSPSESAMIASAPKVVPDIRDRLAIFPDRIDLLPLLLSVMTSGRDSSSNREADG